MTRKRLTPAAAARRAEIVKMRRARLTFAQIGQRLGITPQRCGQIYRAALADVPAEELDEHRVEELDLIDLASNQLMAIASGAKASNRDRIEAWNAVCRWAERKTRLLGLDQPQRHAVMTLDSITAEIQRLEAELAANEGESIP